MLMSLGILALTVQHLENVFTPGQHMIVGHSAIIVGLSFLLGTYAGCISSIAIAPRQHWKIMGYIAVAVGIAWAIYGQFYAGHQLGDFVIESLGAAIGAGLAYFTGYRLFGRASPTP
jgi:hypothetical protein